MTIGIMQPYFLPYIGYWQLISTVDKFVVYDNIKYTKKGWINRNRILVNGQAEYITIPLEKDSDFLDVRERYLSIDWRNQQWIILRKIHEWYKKAPYFPDTYSLLVNIFSYQDPNLFAFIYNSIRVLVIYLDIKTPLIISSTVDINHELKAQDKVLAICQNLQASHYINAIGGVELYNKGIFEEAGIQLNFIKADKIEYKQLTNEFVPWLSILDVMMFNSPEQIKKMLNQYSLI